MRRLWRLLGVAAVLGGSAFLHARFWVGPGPEELARLRQEHAALSARVEARLRGQGSIARAPEGTVLVGVPARVAETLATEVVAGVFREVTLTLRDVRVRKEDEVQATILGRRTLGHFALDLALGEVRAELRPGKPRLTFTGDQIRVALPVTIAEGSGRGRLRLKWDGQGMSGAVCGDLEATLEVAGTVLPVTHTLEGAFDLSTEGSTILARPEFGETKVRVPVQPSKETWKAVEALIDQRGAVCRAALKAADLEGKLRSELGRGVVVTLPRNVLAHEVRLPAAIERPVELPGRSMQVDVRPSGLTIDPARLWFGATVEVRKLTEEEKPGGPSS